MGWVLGSWKLSLCVLSAALPLVSRMSGLLLSVYVACGLLYSLACLGGCSALSRDSSRNFIVETFVSVSQYIGMQMCFFLHVLSREVSAAGWLDWMIFQVSSNLEDSVIPAQGQE